MCLNFFLTLAFLTFFSVSITLFIEPMQSLACFNVVSTSAGSSLVFSLKHILQLDTSDETPWEILHFTASHIVQRCIFYYLYIDQTLLCMVVCNWRRWCAAGSAVVDGSSLERQSPSFFLTLSRFCDIFVLWRRRSKITS